MSLKKWITINERLKSGIALINSLSTKKFQALLIHIVNAKGDIFTNEELSKLKESLKLDENSLQLLIQSISHIFRQSSKIIIKPTILLRQLCEYLGIEEEKSEEFVKIWCNQTNQDFSDLSNRLKLENIAWELNVQGPDQISSKQSLPVARIQFELTNSLISTDKEKLVMEFDSSELLQLYNNLEKIQVKLDDINNIGN